MWSHHSRRRKAKLSLHSISISTFLGTFCDVLYCTLFQTSNRVFLPRHRLCGKQCMIPTIFKSHQRPIINRVMFDDANGYALLVSQYHFDTVVLTCTCRISVAEFHNLQWSIYIIITVTWSEVPVYIKLTGTDHQIKRDAERRVWSSDPRLSTRRDPTFRI